MEDFEHNVDFAQTDDAQLWAKAFVEIVKRNPAIFDDDAEGFMIGWFANAMMRGADSKTQRIQAKIDAHNRELRAVTYYISHHCHRNPIPTLHLETPKERELDQLAQGDRGMLGFVREHLVRLECDDIVSSGQL
ncbi:MAG: hypothetical protein EOP84_12660 [Verrucomicrobiaceae bacterium]|nr:MAG: hypothetical protein EOP84_12660 [Verrucomicrobiaceae bacterium]